MLEIAQKYQIKNIIIPGDFWDQTMYSKFDLDPEDTIDFDYEIQYGRKGIKALKSVFKNIYFTLGSHDIRLWLMLLKQGKKQPFDIAWKLTDEEGLNVSKFRFAEINDMWRITHPKNCMQLGGYPSIKFAAKHEKSVIVGHGHWWGHDQDITGKRHIIFPGCLCDPFRISYKSLWDTSHREWKNGFVAVFEKFIPQLFDDKLANLWLKKFKI